LRKGREEKKNLPVVIRTIFAIKQKGTLAKPVSFCQGRKNKEALNIWPRKGNERDDERKNVSNRNKVLWSEAEGKGREGKNDRFAGSGSSEKDKSREKRNPVIQKRESRSRVHKWENSSLIEREKTNTY